MADHSPYWFPAKRHGWGWGPPRVWQGWVVMALLAIFVVVGTFKLLPTHGSLAFVAYTTCLCAALVGVCWIKGERPSWRGGGK